MTDAQTLEGIAIQFSPELDVAMGKWFGMPCLKVGGKVFVALWEDDLVFKLTGAAHSEALQLEGVRLFDPRGKGHPLKEWVLVPAAQSSTWGRFAQLACETVATASQAKKDQVISELVEARRRILEVASSLSPAQQDEVFLGVGLGGSGSLCRGSRLTFSMWGAGSGGSSASSEGDPSRSDA